MTATAGLTLVLAGAGAALMAAAPRSPLLTPLHGGAAVAALVALAAAFFLTEMGQALVEVRRQAYSFSLSGIPLLLGLLYVPPQHLVAVRLAATAAAFAVQRAPALKFGFNTASYLLDSALVVVVSHLLVGPAAGLDLRTAALTYLALAAVDLVMSGLVILVIRINQGPVSRGEVLEMLAPASAFVALNTGVALVCAVLLSAGGLGALLLALFLLCTGAVYRGFLVLRRRHQSLQVVQDFIAHGEGAATVEDLAGLLLARVRTLTRAARVELLVHRTALDGDRATAREHVHALVGEDDQLVLLDISAQTAEDPLLDRCRPGSGALLLSRAPGTRFSPARRVFRRRAAGGGADSTAEQGQQWLARRSADDAMVVPVAHGDITGHLLVLDRLGDTTTFTADDLALVQALAGHLAVAVHSRHLLQRLRHDATHDVLTGLPNRALLTERISDTLERYTDAAPRPAGAGATGTLSVLLLDLDRFKEVNDALGHHVGDQLLQVVADRLRLLELPGATLARLGGDEFAVLLAPGPGPGTAHVGTTAGGDPDLDALEAARRICAALAGPVDLPEATVSTAASIGIAHAAPGQSHADVLRHADTAMYAAKAAGSGAVVYTPELDRGRAERLALLADLHLALERDELHLHYQPKLDLHLDQVTSVEVLVRWTHPVLGKLGPDVFIPLAESTGLIDELTRQVLTKALRQCAAWQADGLDISVAVNLSARTIDHADLPEQITAALADAGVPAHKLVLEITESAVMGDPERTVPTLERLAATGVTLSLDDFGTGYSSLSYLHRLPVREVKIDRSFVLGLADPGPDAQTSAALVRSIVGLGASLGLRVVAEGVETADVLSRLRALGCDIAQGYHLGRPDTPDHIPRHPAVTRTDRRLAPIPSPRREATRQLRKH